jgi:hypothetical protein
MHLTCPAQRSFRLEMTRSRLVKLRAMYVHRRESGALDDVSRVIVSPGEGGALRTRHCTESSCR